MTFVPSTRQRDQWAAKTPRDLRIAEIAQLVGAILDGKVEAYPARVATARDLPAPEKKALVCAGASLALTRRPRSYLRVRPRGADPFSTAVCKQAAELSSSRRAFLPKTDKLPSGSDWLHEIKHDGFRIIALGPGMAGGAQVKITEWHRQTARQRNAGADQRRPASRPFPEPAPSIRGPFSRLVRSFSVSGETGGLGWDLPSD
jgi:hypothetical protein